MGLGCLEVILRSMGVMHAGTAIAAQAFGAVVGPIYGSAYNARVYNISKDSGDPLQFQIHGEGGWDTGHAVGAVLAALLVWLGVAWPWIIILGLLGTISSLIILRRSFHKGEPSLRM